MLKISWRLEYSLKLGTYICMSFVDSSFYPVVYPNIIVTMVLGLMEISPSKSMGLWVGLWIEIPLCA
jgi:hypothetical protein